MAEERVPLVKQLIADGVGCLICPLLVRAGIPTFPCSGIEGIHELRKSGDGGSRVNPKNLVPCCNWSNGWVEDFPDEAHKLGLVCREGDPDYESLSKRNDRFA